MRHLLIMLAQFVLGAVVFGTDVASGLDYVTLRREERQQRVEGELLVKAEDGGLLLLAPDGTLWAIQPDEIVEHTHDERPFAPLSRAELTRKMLAELPAGFEVHDTAHYLICYNTSRAYAAWCGALFERLYTAFTNFWDRKGFELHEPRFPLVAIIFADRESYLRHAQGDLGAAAKGVVGYYDLRSNRVTTYDVTGGEAAAQAQGIRARTVAQINQRLSRPETALTVATIIHEATHQIAFNDGLQTRFADIPLWVSEGIAVYFETPDLQSAKGWRSIGAVNPTRLERFREYLTRRPADSLRTLIADDKRVREPSTALDAYAEAWALNYFLLRQHSKQYVEYLRNLSAKQCLLWDDPATRVKEFQAAFGQNLEQLDAEFLKYMQKVH